MSFSFASLSAPPVASMKDWITADWVSLEEKMLAEAKCCPDDKEELEEECRMWCKRWADIIKDLGACHAQAEKHGFKLSMSTEAAGRGKDANEQFERWERSFASQGVRIKDRETREVQMSAASPPRASSKSVPPPPSVADDAGDTVSSASKGGAKKMEVVLAGKGKWIDHVPACPRCVRAKRSCAGEEGRACSYCGGLRQRCMYSNGGTPERPGGVDPPASVASIGGSIRKSVSAPGLTAAGGSDPEIVETAPPKRARPVRKAAAAAKGKGKGKAKQAAPIEPAPPTVEDSSDDGASYTKGEIAKIQHDMRVLKEASWGSHDVDSASLLSSVQQIALIISAVASVL
ncbi:hypothetical protein DFH29DRAFT_1008115 [Suillus ampliporus]|nr:hypothetical protein DFH29DRAFT_1008115 [Suillus ampliporus]